MGHNLLMEKVTGYDDTAHQTFALCDAIHQHI